MSRAWKLLNQSSYEILKTNKAGHYLWLYQEAAEKITECGHLVTRKGLGLGLQFSIIFADNDNYDGGGGGNNLIIKLSCDIYVPELTVVLQSQTDRFSVLGTQ